MPSVARQQHLEDLAQALSKVSDTGISRSSTEQVASLFFGNPTNSIVYTFKDCGEVTIPCNIQQGEGGSVLTLYFPLTTRPMVILKENGEEFVENPYRLADLSFIIHHLDSSRSRSEPLMAVQFLVDLAPTMFGGSLRQHSVHVIIYKDPSLSNRLSVATIDSTSNPFGISGGRFSLARLPAWLSGNPLLKDTLKSVLEKPATRKELQKLFNLSNPEFKIELKAINTGIQPSLGDKRCGVFAMNSAYHLLQKMIALQPSSIFNPGIPARSSDSLQTASPVSEGGSDSSGFEVVAEPLTFDLIRDIAKSAHEELNLPGMMERVREIQMERDEQTRRDDELVLDFPEDLMMDLPDDQPSPRGSPSRPG